MYKLISAGCRNNAGVIASGLKILLAPGVGQFDKYMYISTASIRQTLLPQISKTFDWRNTFLETDLANRGVADIPNFLYKEDAGKFYGFFEEFATEYITPYYKEMTVDKDAQLQGFLKDLSTGEPGQSAYIKGFPGPADVKDVKDVVTMTTQMMWLTGVSHHALNTFKAWHYEVAFPLRVGKIYKAAPAEKGQIPDEETLIKEYIYLGPNNSTTAWKTSIGAESIPFGFYPFIESEDLMVSGFFRLATDAKSNEAALKLHTQLVGISDAIRAREAKTADTLPEYAVLDPRNIPYFVFI